MITNKLPFVYIWNNKLTNEYYIGKHTGQTHDGYIASGKLFNFKYIINPDNWEKHIVKEFTDEEYAYEYEKEFIENLYRTDPLCLNLLPGGKVSEIYFKTTYYKLYPSIIKSKIFTEQATISQWLESQLRPTTTYIGFAYNGRAMVYDRTPNNWKQLLDISKKHKELHNAKILFTCFKRTQKSIELDLKYKQYIDTEQEKHDLQKIINNINAISVEYN